MLLNSYLPLRHKVNIPLVFSVILIGLCQVVQTRVWAQGLTLGVIIATGILTHSQRAQVAQMRKVRVSFRYVYP